MTRLILASQSQARLSVLRGAGIEPTVRVSGVDEDSIAGSLGPDASHVQVVITLAEAKARAVADTAESFGPDVVIVGCDSMLSIGGALVGKPGSVEIARQRWSQMAGSCGSLLTGHAVLRVVGGRITARAVDHSATVVRFSTPTETDLEAYLATGEPLGVAGSFTLDGLGGWFVDSIDGDPSSVIGIGLPLLRRLLAETGVSVADLWQAQSGRDRPIS